jgi:hypothetical protein
MISMAALITLLVFVSTTVWAADAVKSTPPAPVAPQLKTPTTLNPPSTLKIEGQTPVRPATPGIPVKPAEVKGIPSTMRIQPDLVITNIKIEPANPTTYDTIKFSAEVTNTGVALAPASKVAVFIGGETFPVTFNQPPIGPNVTKVVVREFKMDKVGGYQVKFVADVDGVVAESNEGNNIGKHAFRVIKGIPPSAVGAAGLDVSNPAVDIPRMNIAFQIGEASMATYSSPGDSRFVFYLRPTKSVDTATVGESQIQVHLKYYNNGALQDEQTLSGHFGSKGPNLMRWESDQTPYGGNCTSTTTCYCEVNLTLQDTILSQEGVPLDGDGDGQPGGDYQHQFFRGMYHP